MRCWNSKSLQSSPHRNTDLKMIEGSKYFYDKSIIQLGMLSTLDKQTTKNQYIEIGKKSDSILLISDPPCQHSSAL